MFLSCQPGPFRYTVEGFQETHLAVFKDRPSAFAMSTCAQQLSFMGLTSHHTDPTCLVGTPQKLRVVHLYMRLLQACLFSGRNMI